MDVDGVVMMVCQPLMCSTISIVGTQIIHMAHVLTPIANAAVKVKPYAHAWM